MSAKEDLIRRRLSTMLVDGCSLDEIRTALDRSGLLPGYKDPLLVNEGQIRQHVANLLDRNFTIAQIQRELDQHYRPRGKAWNRTTVRRIVQRVRMMGPGPVPFDARPLITLLSEIIIRGSEAIESLAGQSSNFYDLVHLVGGMLVLQRYLEGKTTVADDDIVTRLLIRGVSRSHRLPYKRKPLKPCHARSID